MKRKYFDLTQKQLVEMGYAMEPVAVKDGDLTYHPLYLKNKPIKVKLVYGARGRKKPYLAYNFKRTTISASKLTFIWFNGSVPKGYDIDHVDNNSLNNSVSNLQILKHRENCMKKYLDDPKNIETNLYICKYARFCKFGRCSDMSEEEVKDFLAKREMLV